MKTQVKILASFLVIICMTFYACNSDNDITDNSDQQTRVVNDEFSQRKKGGSQIQYNPNGPCPMSGPLCIIPGNTYTFTINCNGNNPSGNVYWTYSGSGITPATPLGPNGLGSSSQSFTFSSTFNSTNTWIQAVCDGSFGCKDQVLLETCNIIPPTCSISGPNCGVEGDILTYTYNGASNVNWTSLSSGITLISSSGNTATFQVNSNFGQNGGSIRGSAIGCNTITFDISNCCVPSIITVDYDRRVYKN
ncbi:hypothetical protein [uncultured Psychroserpens sp.]|uniref:hypothetical protein n=1 Tax=uncultured Psychroserpens sp. TaxID=255436 RepID=UPI0026361F91|nr:hypothetical protein [uncultured Psychroserpens sp.]